MLSTPRNFSILLNKQDAIDFRQSLHGKPSKLANWSLEFGKNCGTVENCSS